MEEFGTIHNVTGSVCPKFGKYAFLLNEDKDPCPKLPEEELEGNFLDKLIQLEPKKAELQVTRLGNLLAEKLLQHSGEPVDVFGPEEVLETTGLTLAPIMYRISCERFIQTSNAPFKIIECRNVTKLSSDWKPSLPDLLIGLGHQVILVDMKDEYAAYYNDFSYAILRNLNHDWEERLPISFFYPDDVCHLTTLPDPNLLIMAPMLPDGELEFSNVKSRLEHNLLTMLKNSCLSAMQNHLLLRDLGIGKLEDAMDGFECIRRIYRELQRRIKSGERVILGATSEQMKLYMATKAGLTISSAESILTACRILDIERDIQDTSANWDDDEDDSDEPFLELKPQIPRDKWDRQMLASRISSESDLKEWPIEEEGSNIGRET